jgi:hypothetical protein
MPGPRALPTRALLVYLRTRTRSVNRPLELRLRHRRAALYPQALRLVVELSLRPVAPAAGRASKSAGCSTTSTATACWLPDFAVEPFRFLVPDERR